MVARPGWAGCPLELELCQAILGWRPIAVVKTAMLTALSAWWNWSWVVLAAASRDGGRKEVIDEERQEADLVVQWVLLYLPRNKRH